MLERGAAAVTKGLTAGGRLCRAASAWEVTLHSKESSACGF